MPYTVVVVVLVVVWRWHSNAVENFSGKDKRWILPRRSFFFLATKRKEPVDVAVVGAVDQQDIAIVVGHACRIICLFVRGG